MKETRTITIRANGKEYQLEEGSSIPGFLDELRISLKRVAVELNRNAITPGEMRKQTLKDGDSLEIVKVVAGG